MIRLGVAVKILGQAGLRGGGAGRGPRHLSLGLLRLREVLGYLERHAIGCYRLPDDLLDLRAGGEPVGTQLAACAALVTEIGAQVRASGVRLSLHPRLHVALGADDAEVAARAASEIAAQGALLDALGASGSVVLHVGAGRGDRAAALERFAARYEALPAAARRRVAVEPDEQSFDLGDLLRLHGYTGIPIVFDALHFQLYDRSRLGLAAALGLALATWPSGRVAEAHFSTQRTEAVLLAGEGGPRVIAPRHGQHSDYINPWEFATFARAARGQRPFDVLLEAKAADLALLRLRDDLQRFAPDVAGEVW